MSVAIVQDKIWKPSLQGCFANCGIVEPSLGYGVVLGKGQSLENTFFSEPMSGLSTMVALKNGGMPVFKVMCLITLGDCEIFIND